MKTKVAVLDWDGVLYDSAEIYVGHFNTVLARYGKDALTLQQFRECAKTTTEEFFGQFGVENIAEAEHLFITLTRGEPQPVIFWDTYDTLRWLRHRFIEVHIVSARPTEDICRLIDRYNLIRFITSVRGNATPERKILALASIIAARNILPDELVFVDDTDVTLEKARSIGCYRVASSRGYCSYERLAAARPDKIIHNLKKLQVFINLIHHSQPQNLPENTMPRKASGK